jgi:hypothetical protein
MSDLMRQVNTQTVISEVILLYVIVNKVKASLTWLLDIRPARGSELGLVLRPGTVTVAVCSEALMPDAATVKRYTNTAFIVLSLLLNCLLSAVNHGFMCRATINKTL